jgi:hypothetical protein
MNAMQYRGLRISMVAATAVVAAACHSPDTETTDPVDGSTTPTPIDAADGPDVDASPEPPWDVLDPLGDGAWIRVRNRCPFPLWIHAAGSSGVLQPDDAELAPGAQRDYEAPATWSAARVTAYRDGPRQGEIDKAEMTLADSGELVSLNYNITYVDWVGLPMRLAGAGGECGDPGLVECAVPYAELRNGCPDPLVEGDVCTSPRSYCLNQAHQGEAFCHALDAEIARCVNEVAGCGGHAGATTAHVYACSNSFGEAPRLCAALNRGMLDAPDDADTTKFYLNDPYNTYAKWVHDVCPGIYAFSYDDWLSQGGFRSCRGSELRITFCPAG